MKLKYFEEDDYIRDKEFEILIKYIKENKKI